MKDRASSLRGWLIFFGIVALLLGVSMVSKAVYVFKGRMAVPMLALAGVILLLAWLSPRRRNKSRKR